MNMSSNKLKVAILSLVMSGLLGSGSVEPAIRFRERWETCKNYVARHCNSSTFITVSTVACLAALTASIIVLTKNANQSMQSLNDTLREVDITNQIIRDTVGKFRQQFPTILQHVNGVAQNLNGVAQNLNQSAETVRNGVGIARGVVSSVAESIVNLSDRIIPREEERQPQQPRPERDQEEQVGNKTFSGVIGTFFKSWLPSYRLSA